MSGGKQNAPDRAEQERQWGVWMAAVQSGESGAYEKLLRAILPSLRSFVMSRMRDPDAAEDVVQNVLLAIHRSRHTYDAARPFGPWMRAVARNAVIDAARVRTRRAGREDALEKHEAVLQAETPKDLNAEISPELRSALDRLPPNQREAVELMHLKDLSVVEAATAVGVSQTAIKVRAHRGRTALRKILSGSAQREEAR